MTNGSKHGVAPRAAILEDGSLSVPARIIPIPATVSKEGRDLHVSQDFVFMEGDKKPTFAELRAAYAEAQTALAAQSLVVYPVAVSEATIANSECACVTPREGVGDDSDFVLINIIGNAGLSAKENLVEAIPLANLLRCLVVRPMYRAKPRYPFAVSVADLIALYETLRQKYRHVGIYGASGGGDLTFQIIASLLERELPLPAAIATWGGNADGSRNPDSFRTNHDLDPMARGNPFRDFGQFTEPDVDPKDPLFSPYYADLSRFPPTLLCAGGRDYALSCATLMHRALRRAGAHAELMVFEGMGHGFSYMAALPEAQELYAASAEFFTRMFGK